MMKEITSFDVYVLAENISDQVWELFDG